MTVKDSHSHRHDDLETASAHLERQELHGHCRRPARKSPWRLARPLHKRARESVDELERATSKDLHGFARMPHLQACAAACGSLQDDDVSGEACEHDEHDLVSYFVVSVAVDVGSIYHASVTNSGGACRQQKQPDERASTWTERSSEPSKRKVAPSLELQM